jgi:hypothetical protein
MLAVMRTIEPRPRTPRVQGLLVDQRCRRIILLAEPSAFITPTVDDRRPVPVPAGAYRRTGRRGDANSVALSCLLVLALVAASIGTYLWSAAGP